MNILFWNASIGKKCKHTEQEKVIILGDFNSNPYEEIMLDFRYFHALPYHKEDVRMILKRRHLLSSEKYISEVKKLVDIDDVEMVLMGTSMKPERFKDEVLAKMKYDAVKKN